MFDIDNIWSIGSNVFQDGLLNFILHSLIVSISVYIVIKLISRTVKRQQESGDAKNHLLFQYAAKTIKTLLYAVLVFSILSQIKAFEGVSKAALGATSIFAVAISLAAQESVSSFIAGFFIVIYHPFKVGDNIILKDSGVSGVVTEITLRHTALLTVENTQIMVPNSTINNSILENRSYSVERYTRYESIGVAYDTDVALAKKIINDVLASTEGIEDVRTPLQIANHEDMVVVRLESFQDSSIELKFPINVKSFGDYFVVASNVREKILKEFNENGIEIPFPIRTVIQKM